MPKIDWNEIWSKKDRIYGELKEKASSSIEWVKENPKEAVGIFAAAGAIVGGIGKTINKQVTVRQERYTKERFIYDHSLNAYLETKRKLTNNDIVRINEERRRTGKKLSEVLAEMKLLK